MYVTEKREDEITATARTILRFKELKRLDDIHESVFRHYESIIDVIEDSDGADAARKISALLHIPPAAVRNYAEQIIDLLIFNKENNPYVRLGLPGFGSAEEVYRRWKRLILLYHPDKYFTQPIYEERAKKINEAYEKIRSLRGKRVHFTKLGNNRYGAGRRRPVKCKKIRRFKYLKYLPELILALVVIAALISLWAFLSDVKKGRPAVRHTFQDCAGSGIEVARDANFPA